MSKTIARYSTTSGLAGCYVPDNVGGPVEFARRKDLADHIRHELSFLEWPANCFERVNIRNLWRHIKRHGSSSAHFSIRHGQYVLAFHGLTEAEFAQQESEQE